MNTTISEFYKRQSPFSDPGKYAHLFEALPDDLPALASVVQGLIIPPYHLPLKLHNLRLEDIELAPYGYRSIESLIAKLLSICDLPLTQARPPRLRLGVNCRNFATLLVSILRHKGVPARERIGFAGYLGGAIHYEHRITEYWGKAQNRWRLVDAFVDPIRRQASGIRFNTLDIMPDDPFYLAAEVWLKARQNNVDPDQFGDSETDIGLPPIRYALMHDFDALNKFEVLGNDTWGELIDKPEADLTADDLQFLDEVARLTSDPDANFGQLISLHERSQYGQEMRLAAQEIGLIGGM